MRKLKLNDAFRSTKRLRLQAGAGKVIVYAVEPTFLSKVCEDEETPVVYLPPNEEVEISVDITEEVELVASEGVFFYRFSARDQTRYRTSDEKFTSLDRPAPLSPEMLAIERLMRRNSIEREKDRANIERLQNQLASRRAEGGEGETRATASEVREPVPDGESESGPDNSSGRTERKTGESVPDGASERTEDVGEKPK